MTIVYFLMYCLIFKKIFFTFFSNFIYSFFHYKTFIVSAEKLQKLFLMFIRLNILCDAVKAVTCVAMRYWQDFVIGLILQRIYLSYDVKLRDRLRTFQIK